MSGTLEHVAKKRAASGKTERSMPAKRPVPKDTFSQRVSANVRDLREKRGWTVKQLAERLNAELDEGEQFAESTIHGWDNGHRKIDPDFYPLLAQVLRVKLKTLLPDS